MNDDVSVFVVKFATNIAEKATQPTSMDDKLDVAGGHGRVVNTAAALR